MLAVLALCWFAGAVAVPFWKTRETLALVDHELTMIQEGVLPASRWRKDDDLWCVENMGGRRNLLANLRMYLNAPKRLAPHRYCAAYFVSFAGNDSRALAAELMEDPDPKVRMYTLRGFCIQRTKEGDPAAVEWALNALKDDDAAVYRQARWLLAPLAFHFPQTVDRLTALLDCGRERETVLAAWTLGEIAKMLSWPGGSESEIAAVRNSLAASTPGLERLLKAKDHEARCVAAVSLWRVTGDGRKPLETLLAALGHEEAEARAFAAVSLARMWGDAAAAAAVPALDRARRDDDPRVRQCASDALPACNPIVISSQPDQDRSALLKKLKDPRWDVRAAAAVALGNMCEYGGQVRPALVEASSDRNQHVRDCAAYALKEIARFQAPPEVDGEDAGETP